MDSSKIIISFKHISGYAYVKCLSVVYLFIPKKPTTTTTAEERLSQ